MKAGRNRLFRADGADARMISLEEYSRYDTTGPAERVATALAAVEKVNPRINAVLQTLGDVATPVGGSASSGARRRLCDAPRSAFWRRIWQCAAAEALGLRVIALSAQRNRRPVSLS